MRFEFLPMVALALLVSAGCAPAAGAAGSAVAAERGATGQPTAHDEYLNEAQNQVDAWRDRMRQWSDEAKAKGSKISSAAGRRLDRAWAGVEADWGKLKAAGPKGWDKARAAFEEASRRLQRSWHDLHAQQ